MATEVKADKITIEADLRRGRQWQTVSITASTPEQFAEELSTEAIHFFRFLRGADDRDELRSSPG